jgi:hypothetical protein
MEKKIEKSKMSVKTAAGGGPVEEAAGCRSRGGLLASSLEIFTDSEYIHSNQLGFSGGSHGFKEEGPGY